MNVEREIVASDGQKYRVAIQPPAYVVYKGTEVFVSGALQPNVVNQGVTEVEAAVLFAIEDIEAELRRRGKGG
ncbi:MAG TPA: hypothetical protein VN201_05690 [Roseateles sp.]|nr:hypothetical protein [Roseateles sp.]